MGRLLALLAMSVLVVGSSVALRVAWEAFREPQPAEAQTTGTCPNAQLIDTFDGNGDQQTDTFNTTTNSFRVSYDVTSSDPEFPASLFIDVIDANDPNQFPVGDATQDGNGRGETFVNAPPGTYFLDISFFGGMYTVTVEQCEGGNPSQGAPPSSPPVSSPPVSAPPTGSPIDQGPNRDLLHAGGPMEGPFPLMPNGECPKQFPTKRGGACY